MTEDQLEQEALSWLIEVGYTHLSGYDIAPDGPSPERDNFRQVLLPQRLRDAIARLNPHIPLAAREDAFKQIQDLGTPVLLSANQHFHRLLVGGVPVQYQKDGETRGDFVRLVDWGHAAANEWLAINMAWLNRTGLIARAEAERLRLPMLARKARTGVRQVSAPGGAPPAAWQGPISEHDDHSIRRVNLKPLAQANAQVVYIFPKVTCRAVSTTASEMMSIRKNP